MDTLSAFAMGQAHRDSRLMVFDWDEAARRIVASGATNVSAGLAGDWEYTGGTIFDSGSPVMESYTYLASTWATPMLDLDGHEEPCWKYEDETPGWGSGTTWPDSALAILGASS